MKTKYIYKISTVIILSLVSFVYLACEKSKVQAAKEIKISISDGEKKQIVGPKGATVVVKLNTNLDDITLRSDKEWCEPKFVADTKLLLLETKENIALDSRIAKISLSASGVSETIEVNQFGIKPTILIKNDTIVCDHKAQTLNVDIYSNVSLQLKIEGDWIKRAAQEKSVSIEPVKYPYVLKINPLERVKKRDGKLIFKQTEGALSDTVIIVQKITSTEDYLPPASDFDKDKKLKVTSASLSPANMKQIRRGIDLTYDDNMSTSYHSPFGGMPKNTVINFEYFFDSEDGTVMNYLVLHPRTSGSNGIIKTATIWVKTKSDQEYKKIKEVQSEQSNQPLLVMFDQPVIEPTAVKISVSDAYSHEVGKYYVSLVEAEFYESKSLATISDDAAYFQDKSMSELIPGFSVDDLKKIKSPFIQNIAAFLLANKYPKEFRVQECEPFRPVGDLAKELKTSGYSKFENPTGIYFSQGDEVIVFVGEGSNQKLTLNVRDFSATGHNYYYYLKEGLNILTMKGKGNGYINYFTRNWESAPKVKVHIASGKVNGYFDILRHSNADGAKMLSEASGEIFDIKGKHIQIAYPVDALKQNAMNELADLTITYDSIVRNQHTLMGLRKYKRVPKNRMFSRVVWKGYMFADGTGAAFNNSTMDRVANNEALKSNTWGVAHELGHVNQVRPGMKWVGTTEITNNIYSAWIQYHYTRKNLRLEHEVVEGTLGGRFNNYFQHGIISGHEWGLYSRTYGIKNGKWGGNYFESLIPLWQLQLYYSVAGKGNSWHKPIFYGDIFEKVRLTNESLLTHGQLQINFVKNACDAAKQDLTDFFIKIGMLKEIDKYCNDYKPAWKKINLSMIEEAIRHGSQYPKPETNYIHYISGNSVNIYKNKLALSGHYNTGIVGGDIKKIDHSVWKNAVVFETYKGEELIHITMVGTGDINNNYTSVPYPTGSTRIEAVGYDGTRILTYGKR